MMDWRGKEGKQGRTDEAQQRGERQSSRKGGREGRYRQAGRQSGD